MKATLILTLLSAVPLGKLLHVCYLLSIVLSDFVEDPGTVDVLDPSVYL